MINELYQLAVAMEGAEVRADRWHREYKLIPNVKPDAPCVRIVLSAGKVTRIEAVDADMAKKLRRYGNNQGFFPGMNLAPLYRVTDPEVSEKITAYIKNQGDGLKVEEVKSWCVYNNWEEKKFKKKYNICMVKKPEELKTMLAGSAENENIIQLIEESAPFSNPEQLHAELSRIVFDMLERRQEIVLALQVLFYKGKDRVTPEEDYGSLSVMLDSELLEDEGIPSVSLRFIRLFNRSLLLADDVEKEKMDANGVDAFGLPYAPLSEPMPAVKLTGGFEASLRTMFEGQPSQYRYHLIENDTYPISNEMRTKIQTALSWISSAEMAEKTWIKTEEKNEILFVYPSCLPESNPTYAGQTFSRTNKGQLYETAAASFREYISKTKEYDPEHFPKNIQIFILRKLDKARTKVVYTRNTTPDELILRSDGWRKAAKNLPQLPFKRPFTPFPLEVSRILNRTWKRDGSRITDKYRPVSSYHGMELLFGVLPATLNMDMSVLVRSFPNLVIFAGDNLKTTKRWTMGREQFDSFSEQIGASLVMAAMLLCWRDIRKEDYMKSIPYLLGQMLKASDSLHELYCWEVREEKLPPQLLGNSMYAFASESPYRALAQLGTRLMPYLAWATKNRDARIIQKDKEGNSHNGPSAGYLLTMYRKTADIIGSVMTPQTRFSDYEKAELFIGYLASFPKSEEKDNTTENNNEAGGNEND
ncbi:MAG: hypothetical protein ACSW8F_00225 [bacterium]